MRLGPSWIINNIVNGKGGWHRRITRRLLVLPFNLPETNAYLTSRRIQLSKLDALRLLPILGGVPYYLSLMQRGESVAAFTDRLFFAQSPDLQGEFDELFDSLFNSSAVHKKIMAILAKTKSGMTRTELIADASLPSGGSLNRYIDNLENSGFIEAHLPLATTAGKDKRYRVCDMFTLFHLRWLKKKRSCNHGRPSSPISTINPGVATPSKCCPGTTPAILPMPLVSLEATTALHAPESTIVRAARKSICCSMSEAVRFISSN